MTIERRWRDAVFAELDTYEQASRVLNGQSKGSLSLLDGVLRRWISAAKP
jgi:hypothetical protein